jgi:outer membrane protein assembly factor BamB
VVAAHGSHVTAFGLAAGDTLWQSVYMPLGDWTVPPTIVGTETVYAKHSDDTLFAFRLSDGLILRTFADRDTGLDKRVFGTGTVPVGDRIHLPTWSRLAAFDTAGPLLWLTEQTGRGMTEPAVGPDGALYTQNRRFGLEVFNPDGTTRWYRRQFLGFGWLEEPRWSWYGGPALAAGGIIYGAGMGGFFAYDTEGTLLWQHLADTTPDGGGFPVGAFVGAPAIGPDGTIYTFTKTHIQAFFGPAPPEPNSPWPMWRHDAQRTGWAR